jgi:hypothetical protein
MGNIHESEGPESVTVPEWLASLGRRDIGMFERMLRLGWKPESDQLRDALVDGIRLMFHDKGLKTRERLRAAKLLMDLNQQNMDVVSAMLRASSVAAAPAAEQHVHIHLGERERRAHIQALLEEGIRNGDVLPPSTADLLGSDGFTTADGVSPDFD